MRVVLIALVLAIIGAQYGYAQISEVGINIYIVDDSLIRQELNYFFSMPQQGPTSYALEKRPLSYSVETDNETPLTDLISAEEGYIISISPEEEYTKIIITMDLEHKSFRSGNLYHFFTDFVFEEEIPVVNTTITLPERHNVWEDQYTPRDAELSTDGRKIILNWEEENRHELFYAVTYERPERTRHTFIVILAAIILVGIVAGAYHYKKKTREIMLKGFREDEQKVIDYLSKNKSVVQRKLQKEYGFTRVKMTRIVQRLEERGLVTKEKYGRTNKLYWKK